MANILLINPSWSTGHRNALSFVTTGFFPPLNLAMVAAVAKKNGHSIHILDLSYREYDPEFVLETVKTEHPDIVGFTASTSLFPQVMQLSKSIKKLSKNIILVAGGSHSSALPKESLEGSGLDIVCAGEGEFSFSQIADNVPLQDILGLVYRDSHGEIKKNPPRAWMSDLDSLPMPAWELFRLKDYAHLTSRLMVKRPIGAYFETSRGCVYQCNYCANVPTQGPVLRKKSVERVIHELKYLKSLGFNEFSLTDNLFTTDIKRAKEICRRIIEEQIDIAWQCHNGIRVDAGDQEMFNLMRKAGCYRVAFGFESGDEEILRDSGKGGAATPQRAFETVRMARKANIEILGYFMVGLPDDTERSMQKTIEFGRKLPLDLLKISYCIPFPGTSFFNSLREKNTIDTSNWASFNVYHSQDFFQHPTLDHNIVDKYYRLGYKRMIYTNPAFLFRRLLAAIRQRSLGMELVYLIKFIFSGAKM